MAEGNQGLFDRALRRIVKPRPGQAIAQVGLALSAGSTPGVALPPSEAAINPPTPAPIVEQDKRTTPEIAQHIVLPNISELGQSQPNSQEIQTIPSVDELKQNVAQANEEIIKLAEQFETGNETQRQALQTFAEKRQESLLRIMENYPSEFRQIFLGDGTVGGNEEVREILRNNLSSEQVEQFVEMEFNNWRGVYTLMADLSSRPSYSLDNVRQGETIINGGFILFTNQRLEQEFGYPSPNAIPIAIAGGIRLGAGILANDNTITSS